jgi:hypothetical protein
MRTFIAVLVPVVFATGCTINVPAKADKGDAASAAGNTILCCRTLPDAGPEGCLCEPASTNAVTVDDADTTCSVNTTLNGQVLDYTGEAVATCP